MWKIGAVVAGETSTAADACNSFWCALVYFYEHGGIGLLAFFALSFLFYKLIWKVWKAMLKSKDDEIERLTNERRFYQSKLFPELLTSDLVTDETQPKEISDRSSENRR